MLERGGHGGACAGAYRVAVRVAARDGVGLVEQAVADLACEVVAEAVKLGLEGLELLAGVSMAPRAMGPAGAPLLPGWAGACRPSWPASSA